MIYDTVVIGAGISGLCSALALAQSGQSVALVEKSARTAPLLRRFNRQGWWCDPGFHYAGGLQPDGPLSVFFRYLKLADLIHSIPLNPDGFDIVYTDDRNPVRFPVGLDRVREALSLHYPDSSEAITAYIERIRDLHSQSAFLNSDAPDDMSGIERALVSAESLEDFLAAHGAEPRLRQMLSRYGYSVCGADGQECPMAIHALTVGSFFFAAHTFARGGDEIAEAFDRRLEEAGVDVSCARSAVGFQMDSGRRLRGVRLAGDTVLECRNCVCTVHPHLLPNLLADQSIRPSFLSRVKELANTWSPLVVYLALDGPPPVELERGNLYFVGRNRDTANGGFDLAAMNCASVDGTAGRASLCLIRSCSPALLQRGQTGAPETPGETYEELKRTETERTVEAFYHEYPILRGRCRVLDAATPRTYESYTSTVAGSAYGIRQSVRQFGLTARTPVKGLYLAGQSVLAPGILGAMISGLLAVSHILGPQVVLSELKKWR